VLYNEEYSMTIALYARVSTKDKGQDTENQLLQLRQFCQQQGWVIAGEYVDQKTGRTADREAFQRLFQHAYEKRFDLCLFWALDRFSREGATDTLQHLRKLTSYGVQWKSFTEQYIDSAGMFGEVIISLLAVLAKQESVRRSERASAAYARLKAQGRTDHLGHCTNFVPVQNEPLYFRLVSLSRFALSARNPPMAIRKSVFGFWVGSGGVGSSRPRIISQARFQSRTFPPVSGSINTWGLWCFPVPSMPSK